MRSTTFALLLVLALAAVAVDARGRRRRPTSGGQMQPPKRGGGVSSGPTVSYSARGPFFTLPLNVGSLGTPLNVGVEGYYGATVLYGVGIQCDSSDSYCIEHKIHDTKWSRTWKQIGGGHDFNLAMGTAKGIAGTDLLVLGDIELDNAMFGVAATASRNLLTKSKASGYIAMNSPVTLDADKTTMQLLVERAAAPTITFSAPMDDWSKHTVTIGAEDTMNCDNDWAEYKSVKPLDPNNMPWTINVNGYSWGSSMRASTQQKVAFSAGGDFYVAPRAVANHIFKQLGANMSRGYYGGMVDCAKRETADDLVIGTFVIPATSYIKRFNRDTCLVNIYPDALNQWTLPYQFHQGRCVKYDYGAKSVHIASRNA